VDFLMEARVSGSAEAEPALPLLKDMWRSRLGPLRQESFEIALLDGSLSLLPNGILRLIKGTTNQAVVFPRQIMQAAIRQGAAAVVLAHNHPNQSSAPSHADKLLTRAVLLAGTTLEVEVLDHLVVTAGDVFSFRAEGLL